MKFETKIRTKSAELWPEIVFQQPASSTFGYGNIDDLLGPPIINADGERVDMEALKKSVGEDGK